MSSGTFRTEATNVAGQEYSRYIYCNWSSVNNKENNLSTISWEILSGSESTGTNNYRRPGRYTSTDKAVPGTVLLRINNQVVYDSGSSEISLYKNTAISSGEIIVDHDPNGTKTVEVSIEATLYSDNKTQGYYRPGWSNRRSSEDLSYSGSIEMTTNPVYRLEINNTNSDVVITRSYCSGSENVGTISSGDNVLCYGDIISVNAYGKEGYAIGKITINDRDFTNGNSCTVSGNVSVAISTTYEVSTVSATNAYIGEKSVLSITQPTATGYLYRHALRYEFGSLTGYINDSGKIQDTKYIMSATQIEFELPDVFYSQIPDSLSDVCKITCITYVLPPNEAIGVQAGEYTTCEFIASVNKKNADCKPQLQAGIHDSNYAAAILTGSSAYIASPENKFIRYRSQYMLEVDAFPQKYSSIKKIKINGKTYDSEYEYWFTYETNMVSLQAHFDMNSYNEFEIEVVDTRGVSYKTTITPTVINYAILTFNPTVERKNPTSNEVTLSCVGTFYNENFGILENKLYIKYRHKQSDTELWSDWLDVDTSTIVFADGQYRTPSEGLLLGDNFSYKNSYDFEFYVRDGNDGVGVAGNVEHYILTEITKTAVVYRGVPIFDWGGSDFVFNVPVTITTEYMEDDAAEQDCVIPININNTNILDILYPKGSVYLSTSSSPPKFLQHHWGEYTTIDIGNGINAFTASQK